MNMKKIVPCLDVRNGRVVKGINFEGIQDVEDPVVLAELYCASGADELVFYDITASVEERALFSDILKRVAAVVTVPLMVGGGLMTIEDCDRAVACGANRLSINTGAIKNPDLINEAAAKYGSDCVVLAMDVRKVGDAYHVFTSGGRVDTGIDALLWAEECERRGAGELVLNSIDTDGVKGGFDIDMLQAVCGRVSIPVVASGGAGCKEDFLAMFEQCPGVESGLAASIFHRRELDIAELKDYLAENGVQVRGRE